MQAQQIYSQDHRQKLELLQQNVTCKYFIMLISFQFTKTMLLNLFKNNKTIYF